MKIKNKLLIDLIEEKELLKQTNRLLISIFKKIKKNYNQTLVDSMMFLQISEQKVVSIG